jgi:hypothetical protein
MGIEGNVAAARETFEAMERETEGVSGCSKGEGTFMEQALAGHPSGM